MAKSDLKRDYPDLSIQQWRAIHLLASHPGVQLDDVAKQLNISRQTLYRWRKRRDFFCAFTDTMRRLIGTDRLRKVIDRICAGAERGDTTKAKLLMQWLGQVEGDGVSVDVDVAVVPETVVFTAHVMEEGLSSRIGEYADLLHQGRIGSEEFALAVSAMVGRALPEGSQPASTPAVDDQVVDAEIVEPKPMNLRQSSHKRFMDNRPWLPENRNKR